MSPAAIVQAAAPPTCATFDVECRTVQGLRSGFAFLVDAVARATAEVIVDATTWWTSTDSVNPLDPAVTAAQAVTRPLVALILVASVLAQAIRLIVSRKGEPLMAVAVGLVRYAVTAALGLTLLQGALRAGDAFSRDILHDAATNFAELMRTVLVTQPQQLYTTLPLSTLAAVLAAIQWVLMMLRQAGLLVLAATLPLAASGSLNRATRAWLDRLLAWLVAIVVYKPAAAFIYYLGFSYMSSLHGAATDWTTLLTGVTIMLLAVVAMPALLKFFSWSGTQVGGSGGSGSGLLAAAGAVAVGHAGRGHAVERAAATEGSGPGTGPAGAARTGASAAAAGKAAAGPAGVALAVHEASRAAVRGAAGHLGGPPPPGAG